MFKLGQFTLLVTLHADHFFVVRPFQILPWGYLKYTMYYWEVLSSCWAREQQNQSVSFEDGDSFEHIFAQFISKYWIERNFHKNYMLFTSKELAS